MARTSDTLAAMWLGTFGAGSIVPNFAELLKEYSFGAVNTATCDVTSLFDESNGELEDPMVYLLDLCAEYTADALTA